MTEPAPNPDRIPTELHFEHQKVLHIIKIMNSLNLTPKKFLSAFLNNDDADVKTRRALWVSPEGRFGGLLSAERATELPSH
ncbi:hypothetical protein PtA15_4A171 [Puccinia triticina]|uniref:Uncharacterized protein n=1 Tax=Puccinia triticina TaxID=208348 RepID=A0ABY7CEV2_9BASI|nr:uncharacterized protein PtA15_4A171 [Puccinia triticina]WAQ83723.1 hypothetical protein PtA15_4A171 [Puccinia triticina]